MSFLLIIFAHASFSVGFAVSFSNFTDLGPLQCHVVVSRGPVSAPPGFTGPNRAPPPGFSSPQRTEPTFDAMSC